jgi:hypothetical protein
VACTTTDDPGLMKRRQAVHHELAHLFLGAGTELLLRLGAPASTEMNVMAAE